MLCHCEGDTAGHRPGESQCNGRVKKGSYGPGWACALGKTWTPDEILRSLARATGDNKYRRSAKIHEAARSWWSHHGGINHRM